MSRGALYHHSWSHVLPGWTLRGHYPVLQGSLSSSHIWRLITDRLVCPVLPSSDSGQMISLRPWLPPRRPIQGSAFQHVSQVRGTCPSLRDSHQPRSLCHDAPRLYTSRALALPAFFTGRFPPFVFPGGCVSASVTFLPGVTLCPSASPPATNAAGWAPAPPREGGSAEGVGSPRITQPFHGLLLFTACR